MPLYNKKIKTNTIFYYHDIVKYTYLSRKNFISSNEQKKYLANKAKKHLIVHNTSLDNLPFKYTEQFLPEISLLVLI